MAVAAPDLDLAARTEAEVAADTLWALIEAGILSRKVPDVARYLWVAGLTRDDLRLASIRWERRHGIPAPASHLARLHRVPTKAERTCPELALDDHQAVPPTIALIESEGGANGGHSRHAASAAADTPTELLCRRCRQIKPVDDFPTRRNGSRKTWCRTCSIAASERSVGQRKVMERALLAVVLEHGDECVGMACEACNAPLRPGDTMLVEARPRHEVCPA